MTTPCGRTDMRTSRLGPMKRLKRPAPEQVGKSDVAAGPPNKLGFRPLRRTRGVWIALLAAMVFGLLAAAWQPADRGLRYAVHTLPADERALQLARDAGVDTIVELFSWRQIEPTEGQFHWQHPDEVVQGAEYYGLDVVARIDQHPHWVNDTPLDLNAPPNNLADYARFVSDVARRYRGRIKAYIVWNEPNLALDWGGRPPDPAGYTELLCAAFAAVKSADPEALVVSAGLAPTNHDDAEAMDDRRFLREMLEAGAVECMDVVGAHPYGFGHPPSDPRGAHDGLNLARLEDQHDLLVEYGAADKPVWATEMGWTAGAIGENAWQTVSPEQQANYLRNALERMEREWPWVGLAAVWYLGPHDVPEWSGYSLLDAEGSPRPVFDALQNMPKNRLPELGERLAPRQRQERRAVLLEQDSVIHLGDSDFDRPWMPLSGNRNPSTAWQGAFYLADPGAEPWRLTLRVMQSNVPGNHVWINGRRLTPDFPAEDFSSSWVSVTYDVPARLLRPGANEIKVTINRTLPLLQDKRFAWDDLQIKDMVLWR